MRSDPSGFMNPLPEPLTVSCPVCGSDRFRLRYPTRGNPESDPAFREGVQSGTHHPIVECLDCGVAYTRPRDPDGVLSVIYSSLGLATYLEQERAKEEMFVRQLARIEELCGGRGRLLELGCAAGLFCRVATRRGWEAIGCDSWEEAVEYGRERWGLDLRVIPDSDWGKIEGEYDAVVFWDTIEHLPRPVRVLEGLRNRLRDNGILALSTPNYNSLSRKLLGTRWHFFERPHLVFFSRKTLIDTLIRSGYAVCFCRSQSKVVTWGYLARYLSKWSPFFSLRLKKIIDKMGTSDLLLRLPGGMMIAYASRDEGYRPNSI